MSNQVVQVNFVQRRTLGLLPEVSLVALVEAYAAEMLQLRYRRIPGAADGIQKVLVEKSR